MGEILALIIKLIAGFLIVVRKQIHFSKHSCKHQKRVNPFDVEMIKIIFLLILMRYDKKYRKRIKIVSFHKIYIDNVIYKLVSVIFIVVRKFIFSKFTFLVIFGYFSTSFFFINSDEI